MTPAALRLAPSAACEGVFRTFRPSGACAWVALPAWAKMQAGADAAVALQVPDTRALTVAPAVAATAGPALLVVDRSVSVPHPESYFLVARAPSALLLGAGGKPLPQKLELAAGGAIPAGATLCGKLVLVVRPPTEATNAPKNLPPGLRDLGIADDDGEGGDGEGDGVYTLGQGNPDDE